MVPGMLGERNSDGKLQKHRTQDGKATPIFLFEKELEGKGIDEELFAGEKVQGMYPRTGDEVQIILADGESVEAGDYLTSNGDGTMKKSGADQYAVVQAMEALDLSGSSGEESSGVLGYDKRLWAEAV